MSPFLFDHGGATSYKQCVGRLGGSGKILVSFIEFAKILAQKRRKNGSFSQKWDSVTFVKKARPLGWQLKGNYLRNGNKREAKLVLNCKGCSHPMIGPVLTYKYNN